MESFEILIIVTVISKNTFAGYKSLKTIVILDSVKEIGSRAFRVCESLESIELQMILDSIKDVVFASIPLLRL